MLKQKKDIVMKTIVKEPKVTYKRNYNWLPYHELPITLISNGSICRIEDNRVYFLKNDLLLIDIFSDPVCKDSKRLSHLRGKTTKQSEKEINDQLSSLRNEWERDI